MARIEDPVDAATLLTLIDGRCAPRHATDEGSLEQRQADALLEGCAFVLAHGDDPDLPSAGIARLTVHMQLTDLENRLRAANLDLGDTLPATAARRLCCDAGVIPVVLDGAGPPLDVGRPSRSIPDPIRRAVTAPDRGCAHPGCDRPPSWSEIPHIHEWPQGGATRLDNLVVLCRIHHREIHATAWTVAIAADGLPEFIPPRWLDNNRTPRRRPRAPLCPNPNSPPPPGTYPPRERTIGKRRSTTHARARFPGRIPHSSPEAPCRSRGPHRRCRRRRTRRADPACGPRHLRPAQRTGRENRGKMRHERFP
ncbi:HNH endonuclease signature motif containing protein [Pseudonocardia humida]|uniref:HNH endonuclease signature motif containing protein n=1 Tax=Pseudonocardia humida TaxID=2800819 RepID=UPI0035566E6D